METAVRKRPVHLGDHVRRMRTALGVKQASLASELGTTQQNISRIEQEEDMDKATLEKIAKALGVTPEAIENFPEEGAMFNVQTLHDNASGNFNNYTFNPIEKIVELYDALLKAEREKNELLERMLKGQTPER
ncbi:helix-turn-helix domain-containing protein [Pontibacter chinhatensis]|uniref:DNA-binding transcriptional regulator, XRE-family HTH domain n=1 Tax=Pontibacter chinhatensis TaxID=1436961 RepID=A0A1I2R3F2_9BACT|nr:helix-turn-helix transcriptional regulator [Pontibacter chinhatensis]SFG32336.1 DNA-binding transcriptional regulator, XRE-family HTH domain [Pontibacter chinhatensis]